MTDVEARESTAGAKMSLPTLTAMVVGGMVGAGVFSLPARFGVATAATVKGLKVEKDGVTFHTETVTSNDHTFDFHATEHGRYRLQLERGPTVEVVSSPIWFEPLPARPGKGCGDRNHAHDDSAACK